MARTNASVTIYRRTKTYSGSRTTSTVGTYDAWIEEHINWERIQSVFGGSLSMLDKARGLGIIFSDVDLLNTFVTYGGKDYEILKFAKFMDYRATVRHVEFIYG